MERSWSLGEKMDRLGFGALEGSDLEGWIAIMRVYDGFDIACWDCWY
jgi:hypothetical protein